MHVVRIEDTKSHARLNARHIRMGGYTWPLSVLNVRTQTLINPAFVFAVATGYSQAIHLPPVLHFFPMLTLPTLHLKSLHRMQHHHMRRHRHLLHHQFNLQRRLDTLQALKRLLHILPRWGQGRGWPRYGEPLQGMAR
jgi:hypothetical protein